MFTMYADYAIDLIYEEPGFSGQVLDRSALGAALARQFAAHPGIGFLTHDIIAAGNRVIAEGEVRWQEPGRTRIVHQALFYTLALKNAQVPVELHVYPTGGHGYGLRRTSEPITSWPERLQDWFIAQGLYKK